MAGVRSRLRAAYSGPAFRAPPGRERRGTRQQANASGDTCVLEAAVDRPVAARVRRRERALLGAEGAKVGSRTLPRRRPPGRRGRSTGATLRRRSPAFWAAL